MKISKTEQRPIAEGDFPTLRKTVANQWHAGHPGYPLCLRMFCGKFKPARAFKRVRCEQVSA